MPSYRVSTEAFYGSVTPDQYTYSARMQLAIGQLVRRYGITGKSILSLGAGLATEEYYLWKAGNRLTIVDIDEHQGIEPRLKDLPPGDMHYIIGDANEVEIGEPCDLIFTSSLTPDEIRRDDILRKPDAETRRRMLELNNGSWEWPWWEDPFHPLLMRTTRHLGDDGLMIIQSYYGGFDVLDQRYYLWACDRQLAEHGMTLLEVYRFAKTTGVMLYVAGKGGPRSFPLTPAITAFHGRGEAEAIQCLRICESPEEGR